MRSTFEGFDGQTLKFITSGFQPRLFNIMKLGVAQNKTIISNGGLRVNALIEGNFQPQISLANCKCKIIKKLAKLGDALHLKTLPTP